MEGHYRREGPLERAKRTQVSRQRRRQNLVRSLWAIAAVIGIIAVLVLGSWGASLLKVQRDLGGRLRGDDRLRAVIREPLPETGKARVAVLSVRGGQLLAASVLGLEPERTAVWVLSVPGASVIPLGETPVDLQQAWSAGRVDRVVAAVESVSGVEVAGVVVIDAEKSRSIGSGTGGESGGGLTKAQRGVLLPLFRALAETRDPYGLLVYARQARGSVTTDLGIGELASLARRFKGVTDSSVVFAAPQTMGGRDKPVPDSADARRLVRLMAAGKPIGKPRPASPAPASVSVEIQNGAGIDGVASAAARILKENGFDVRGVGNANQFIYDETLVIFEQDERAARDVARLLPKGRVVESRGMYHVSTDVLVIVGKDWPLQP